MDLIFDESGDWGTLSERYYVIGGFITPNLYKIRGVTRRSMQDIKKEFPRLATVSEIKAQDCPGIAKDYLLRKLVKENIKIFYIVVDKNNIQERFLKTQNQNVFYNYQLGLLAKYIRNGNNYTVFNFSIDNRSIKVASLNSFQDYIFIELNFKLNKETHVSVKYRDSEHFYEIQAADFICNALWTRENYRETDNFSDIIWHKTTRLKFPIDSFGKS